jgi:hypothetical protein
VGIVLSLKHRQRVVGISESLAVSAAVLPHGMDKPLIQDMVEKRIGNHGRDNRALRAAKFVIDHTTRALTELALYHLSHRAAVA